MDVTTIPARDFRRSIFLLLALIAQAAWSAEGTSAFFPQLGRIQASGTISNYGILSGDGMLPVYGDRDGFLFGDLMGGYGSNNSYVVSPGAGYRQVFDNHIWGAYLFADYQRPNVGGNFWDVSPGIEWMNPRWDAHANVYFPTNQKQSLGSAVFANTVGDYSQTSFSGNNQIDAYVTPYAAMGNGVDAEIGYSLSGIKGLRTRLYVGGYYYAAPDISSVSTISNNSSMTGVSVGVEVPMNKYFSLAVANSYDNVNRNTAALSLNITFGGNSNIFSDDVHDRLLDTVERHIGIIGTGAGAYAQKEYVYTGATAVQYNNVYFISPNGSSSSSKRNIVATYENPGSLDQTTLTAINNAQGANGARIYIQGGSDALYNVNTTTAPDGALTVYNGQSFYGRSASYVLPATSNTQPIVSIDGGSGTNGFLIPSGEVTFDNLAITASSTSGSTIGISAVSAGADITVNFVNTNLTALNQGLYAENDSASTLTFNAINSSFNNNTNSGGNNGAYGIYILNNGSGALNINTINSQFNGNTDAGNHGAWGMFIQSVGNLNINVDSSPFNGNIVSGDSNGGAYGMFVNAAQLNMNVTNSTFNGNINSGSGSVVLGLQIVGGNTQVINITNSQFNGNIASADNNLGAVGLGISSNNTNSVTLNVTGSQFNNNVASGDNNLGATGFAPQNSSGNPMIVSVSNSQFNGNTASGDSNMGASGLGVLNAPYAEGNGGLILSAINSQFNGNIASGNNNGGGDGFYAENDEGTLDGEYASALSVTSLSGSNFSNNSNYGIYAIGNPSATTTVNYANTSFSGNLINVGSGGYVTFTQ